MKSTRKIKNKTIKNRNKTIKNRNKTNKIKIGGTKKQKFIKLSCSPENDKNSSSFTCYSNDDLNKLKEIWNTRHPDNTINTNDTKEIWNNLKIYYNKSCNKESCWVKKLIKDKRLEKDLLDAFAPKSPDDWKKNPNEWLSSIDILSVMSQYEKKYKCFEFLGPSPIDFDTKMIYGECVWEELCHFNLENMIKNGKFKIGIIFNTDPHYKSGSHWISLFINCKKSTIFFFDSAGDPVPTEIKKLVDKIIEQGHNLNKRIDFKFDQNYPVEHQYGNTECGIYSLFFIVHMLQDKISQHYLKTHILKDEYMQQFRKVYFNEDL
jgi:hypothetical protein